jgi:hypothetical protein
MGMEGRGVILKYKCLNMGRLGKGKAKMISASEGSKHGR